MYKNTELYKSNKNQPIILKPFISFLCSIKHITYYDIQINRNCRHWWDPTRSISTYSTTYAISSYHNLRCEFKSRSNETYSIQHYVIKFIS